MARTKSYKISIAIAAGVLLCAVAIGVIVWALTSRKDESSKPYTKEGYAMNTVVTQQIYSPTDPQQAEELAKDAERLLSSLEEKFSMHHVGTEIDRLNQNAGGSPVELSEDTFSMLRLAKVYGDRTNGLFDVTIGPLTSLWGITSDQPRVPSDAEIAAAKELIEFQNIQLDEKKYTAKLTKAGMKVDLGGIAKGYASDRLMELYREYGAQSVLTSVGGNIIALGKKPDGSDFSIGIRDPQGNANEYVGTLKSPDTILSTTGGYERYFEKDGVRYHHVLDPKTGKPAQSDLLAVTIVSEDGTLTDVFSTYYFMMGKKTVLKHLNDKNYSIIAIDQEKNIYLSDKLKPNFTLNKQKDYRLAD